MIDTVWLVYKVQFTQTGNGSQTVPIANYKDYEPAQSHAINANYWLEEWRRKERPNIKNPWDPDTTYDGMIMNVRFYVQEIGLFHDVAQFRLLTS